MSCQDCKNLTTVSLFDIQKDNKPIKFQSSDPHLRKNLRDKYVRTAAYFVSFRNPDWSQESCWYEAENEIDNRYQFLQEARMCADCLYCSNRGTTID